MGPVRRQGEDRAPCRVFLVLCACVNLPLPAPPGTRGGRRRGEKKKKIVKTEKVFLNFQEPASVALAGCGFQFGRLKFSSLHPKKNPKNPKNMERKGRKKKLK